MSAQTGILPLSSLNARVLIFRLNGLALDELKAQLRAFEMKAISLRKQFPETPVNTTLGFGLTLWQQLNQPVPEGLRELAPINGAFVMPADGGDVLVHIHCDRTDLCFALLQTLLSGIQDRITVLDEQAAFKNHENRDFTGFIDGTENPVEVDERVAAALISAGDFKDGSFVFTQRFVHNLAKWNRLNIDAQEHVIGRTKADSIELDDEVRPENAHISRVIIEDEAGEELAILRHSLPYGSVSGEHGLYFIAYMNDLDIMDQMLANMFANDEAVADRLLNFTTPVSGAYFFAPSQVLLNRAIA